LHYPGSPGPYSEGGITVEQINPRFNIWVDFFHPEGAWGWYPDAGNFGYTKITLTGGGNFESVGMLVGSGGTSILSYELLKQGTSVLQGGGLVLYDPRFTAQTSYIGFSGGGFDTVLLRGGTAVLDVQTDTSLNALAVDSIETTGAPFPEPGSLVMFSLGAAYLIARRCRRSGRSTYTNGIGYL
jgi:hypothetical protein